MAEAGKPAQPRFPERGRRYLTFRCFGCPAFAHVRAPAGGTKPKAHPLGWTLVAARFREADGGVEREASIPFCSRACVQHADVDTAMARRLNAYLGRSGPPPTAITFRCAGCGVEVASVSCERPDTWLAIPIVMPDFDVGVVRQTRLPVCSQRCANAATGPSPTPVAVAERTRLLAGRGVA